MAVTESFLVNTNSFNPIIEALIERDEAPDEITDELFASMGFESPSELLVIHMLKELNMLTVEGKPTELYHELTNPDTTDEALATGILHAYTDLFKQNPEFYKLQKEDIYKELEDHFEGRKTELILKYMTNTFHKLVSYAGLNNMQKAIDEHLEHDAEEVEAEEVEAEEVNANGEVDSKNEEVAAQASSEEMEDSEEHDMEEAASEEEISDSEQADDAESEEDEAEEIVAEAEELEEDESEADEEFDAVFFSEEEEATAPGKKKGSINFDELPKVQREEKGSESIDEFLNADAAEDSGTEEVEEEAAEAESEVTAEAETEEDISSTEEEETDTEIEEKETTDQEESESLSDKQKETLEKELMEIDMESTNGLHKNGADNAEKPMTNISNVPTKEKVEKAIIKKAELLYKLERFEDVLPAYKDVISYFDGSDKDHLQEAVAKAVINRVSVLKKLNKDDELLPALEEVISRFEDSSVNEYYEHASLAMLDKAQLLEDASAEDLLPLFNDIIERLKNASTPKVKTQVDEIFVKKVDILTETGPEQKLLDAVDELIDRFEGSQTHTGQLEQAMYKKAEVLENLGRDEEALEAYSEFLDRFGQTKEMV